MAGSTTPGLDVGELLEHAEWLKRLAVHLVRDPDDADDLAQMAMEEALVSPPKQAGPLRPWLGGVVRNLARMHWRSTTRRRSREQSTQWLESDELVPDQLLEKARAFERVARSVTELREPFRQAVLLRYYEGLSSAEIARRLEIPAATVRSRLKTGLDCLRAELHKDGERPVWAPILAPIAPLPLANGGATLAAAEGALVLKTSTKVIAVVALIVAAVFGTRALGWWGAGDGEAEPELAATEAKAAQAVAPTSHQPAPVLEGAPILSSADPLGVLRLEGQVVDEEERPVGGAEVALNSHPPQVVVSEEDGSFAFSRLIARDYALEATSGSGYAGFVRLRLQANTEPVILRLRPSRTVKVRVLDNTGTPLANANVELRSQLTWSGASDNNGELVLAGVGARSPIVVVSAKGFARAARRLTLSRKEETVVVRLKRGVAVSGRVVDSAGKPVAGARVLPSSASESFVVMTPARDGIETDAKGNWSVPTLSPGVYRFTASHPAFATASLPPISVERSLEGLEIELEEGSSIAGRVLDQNGSGVAGADVRFVARGSVHWRTARRAFSDDSGAFRVDGIANKQVDVVASHKSGSSEIAVLELSKPTTEIVLELRLTSSISGIVVDGEGLAIAEAQVRIGLDSGAAIEERHAWSVRGQAFQLTDAGGRFSFDGVPNGAYRVRASRAGTSRHALWVGSGLSAKPGDDALRIELPGDGSISGTVLFKGGEAPAAFTVALGGGSPMPFTGEERGKFALVAPPGDHGLIVRGPSFTTVGVNATVTEARETKVGTIAVSSGRSISGRVFDSNGRAVAEAEVVAGSVISGDGKRLFIESESPGGRSTTTDEQGNFVLTGFEPGRLTVVAAKDGLGRSVSLTLRPSSESEQVDLILEPVGRLRGTITLDGKPLADTAVVANPEAATTSNFFVVTGPDGSYAFDQLTAGKYIIYPMIGGGRGPRDMHIKAATVVAGKDSTIDVSVSTGSLSLELTVAADDKSAIAFAQVFVIGAAYAADHASTLLDGGTMVRELGLEKPVPVFLRPAASGRTTVNKLSPGTYSACVVPIPIDPANPQAAMKDLREKMATLPMKCETYELTGNLSRTVTVPAAWTRPLSKE